MISYRSQLLLEMKVIINNSYLHTFKEKKSIYISIIYIY